MTEKSIFEDIVTRFIDKQNEFNLSITERVSKLEGKALVLIPTGMLVLSTIIALVINKFLG